MGRNDGTGARDDGDDDEDGEGSGTQRENDDRERRKERGDRPAAAIHTYTLCAALHCGNQVLVVDGQTIRRITRARQGPRSYPPDLARNGREG